MKIEPMLTPAATRRRLEALIAECDSFSWASAWVTKNPAFDAVLVAKRKMRHGVIGTHRYITDVHCLSVCKNIPSVKVVAPEGPLFHPKVYAFRCGDRISVYLGSSNLTMNGMTRNIECGVVLTAEAGHSKLERYFGFIGREYDQAEEIDDDFVASYRANKRRVKDAQAELKTFVRFRKPNPTRKAAHQVDPSRLTWAEFLRLVRDDEVHGPTPRLRVLAHARKIFDRGVPFAKLSQIEQRSLAGMLRPATREGVDWGFFGQMSAYGRYYRVLEDHLGILSRALDQIPLREAVKRRHFEAYLDIIKTISDPPVRIGLGTRLLAMKRPDQFVCIDNANRYGLCGYFGVAPTTTTLDNYWDRIIAPMRQMPWWLADSPTTTRAKEIWQGRAAMLDAIYYDPQT
jgi:HKD family nuclease